MYRNINYCLDLLKKSDYNYYLSTLFCDDKERNNLALIYAILCEIKNISYQVSEPINAMIRYKWWHENIKTKQSPLLEDLAKYCKNNDIYDDLKNYVTNHQEYVFAEIKDIETYVNLVKKLSPAKLLNLDPEIADKYNKLFISSSIINDYFDKNNVKNTEFIKSLTQEQVIKLIDKVKLDKKHIYLFLPFIHVLKSGKKNKLYLKSNIYDCLIYYFFKRS